MYLLMFYIKKCAAENCHHFMDMRIESQQCGKRAV